MREARSFGSRLRGLALRDEAGWALLIRRCRCVHTFGMRFALDLVWLDAEGRVMRVDRGVRPRRVVRCRKAAAVVEVPSPARRAVRGAG